MFKVLYNGAAQRSDLLSIKTPDAEDSWSGEVIYCIMTELFFPLLSCRWNSGPQAQLEILVRSLGVRLRFDPWKVLRWELTSACENAAVQPAGCVTQPRLHWSPFGRNASGFFPNIQGGSRRVPRSQGSVLGTKQRNKSRFHPRGEYVHHPVRPSRSLNDGQMNK